MLAKHLQYVRKMSPSLCVDDCACILGLRAAPRAALRRARRAPAVEGAALPGAAEGELLAGQLPVPLGRREHLGWHKLRIHQTRK